MVSDARGSGIRPPAVVTGPLAEPADGFRRFLVDQGYARGTIGALMSLTAHISQWLDDQGSVVDALGSAAEVEHFFAERRAQGYRARLSPRALAPLLGFLRDRHVIQAAAAPAAAPAEVVLEEYRDYPRHEREAAASTVVKLRQVCRDVPGRPARAGAGRDARRADRRGRGEVRGRLRVADQLIPLGCGHGIPPVWPRGGCYLVFVVDWVMVRPGRLVGR
jgi:hypothetical protein